MTHDPAGSRPDGANESTDQPPPSQSAAGEATGTRAFVSPFAASPASSGAPSSAPEPGPAPDMQAGTSAAPPTGPAPTFGRPDWGPADQPGWANTATGAVGGGSWAPGAPADQPPTWGSPTVPDQSPMWGAPAAPDPNGTPPTRWKTWQKVTAGGVLAGVVAIGAVAAISAANASSTEAATSQAGFAGGGQGFGGQESGSGARGGMAGAMELANALHGDFVVSSGTGTQTMRLQTGELTAVDGGSITVTSTDGYTSTYALGSGVDASGLAQGATVRVIATVQGDTATATSVTSGTAGFGGTPGQAQSGTGRGGSGMQPPEGMTPPEGMQLPEGMTPPEGMAPPDGADQALPTS